MGSAFHLSGLRSIHLAAPVTNIYDECFARCESLESVTFESASKLSCIPFGAFSDIAIKSIHVPASVEILAESCFSHCRFLESITFESISKLQRIERWAFFGTGLTSLHLPASVDRICETCISQCPSLVSFTIAPDSMLTESDLSKEFRGRFSISVPRKINRPRPVPSVHSQVFKRDERCLVC
jgi:hypothetical protein